MTDKADISLNRVDWWLDKFQNELEERINTFSESPLGENSTREKDAFFLNKLATLCVGMEHLKERISELEKTKSNTKS